MADRASASLTSNPLSSQDRGEPASVPEPAPAGRPAGTTRPVPLAQLLAVAALTPAQAVFVAGELLRAADARGLVDGEVRIPALRLGAVTISPSGDVEVATDETEEGAAVPDLLEQLLRSARRLPAHPKPEQLRLLHSLETAAAVPALDPGARAHDLETALSEALGSGAPTRLAGQLAALAEAFTTMTPFVPAQARPSPSGDGAVRPPTPSVARSGSSARASRPRPPRADTPRHSPVRGPRSRSRLHRRVRGRRMVSVLLVLAAALALGGYVLLRGSGADIVGALGHGSQPAAPATTTPAAPGRSTAGHRTSAPPPRSAVPALARAHAGPVTGVTLQKTGSCRPGAWCPVKVTVHLRPAATTQSVAWKVGAARLCTRGIAWSPTSTVTAQPGWTTVYANSSVRVPKGRSLALTALTTSPARAQSRPVPVTGSSLHC